jgi:hypothetical protein
MARFLTEMAGLVLCEICVQVMDSWASHGPLVTMDGDGLLLQTGSDVIIKTDIFRGEMLESTIGLESSQPLLN